MRRTYNTAGRVIRLFMAFILISGSVAFGFGSALPSVHADTAVVENVEGFEMLANIAPASVRANSVKLDLVSRPEAIPYGYHAARLSYDFTGTIGTSAAYINFKDPSGTAGRTLQGSPKKLGVWVYGDAGNHWLRGQVQDAGGAKTAIDFTSSTGLNWTGWKYVTANLPANIAGPVKLNQIYVTETKDNNKNSGALYFDQLKAFYSDTSVFGLDLVGLPPMQVGDAKQAKVFATNAGSVAPVEVTSGLTFSSSNDQVAAVDVNGMVRALQPGVATITATYGNAPQASYSLTVSTEAPVPQRLELQAVPKLENGSKDRVKIFAVYSDLTEPVSILSGAVLQSSNPEIASIDATGQITTLKVGSTTITANYGGVTASYTLTVTEPVPVLQKIELPGLKAMIIGETQQVKVMGTYTWLPEPVEITSGVTYTSSNPAIATVSSTGLITAIKFGTTRITAVYGGKTADFYLVVNKEPIVPKRELRAAWIASVDNVDWPEKGVVTAEEQKRDFIAKLDELQAAGMNAAIVQIKPTADAFYPSQYGPWSEWLTGEQGKDPGYNPLAFMLEEVHKRNLEFHAWFNPYRISLHDDINRLVPDHPARLHPDWVVSYGGRLYFNPGIPEAQDFIREGIMEVVKNYDIDAVHFDDYFYPYPVAGVDFPDDATYRMYGSGFANKADWRRDNVNTFIRSVNEAIKQEKSYVKFGISPFGIWRNKAQDPTGSETNGLSSYDAIYADSKKWIQQGWIDYITPQIYWYMGYTPAAYDKLIEWWSQVTQGTNVQLYSGKATYRIGSSESWLNPDEMPNQIAYDRNFEQVDGSIFFSTKSILSNLLGFTDRLKNDLYRYPALVPAMPHLDSAAPAPAVLKTAVRKAEGVQLTWEDAGNDAAYYAIYRFDAGSAVNIDVATHLLGSVRKQGTELQTYTDKTAVDGSRYTYVVTALDRLHNESTASNEITITNVLDVTAPVTEAVVEGEKRGDWYVSDVSVKLSASDDLTGVVQTEYSLDNGQLWQRYEEPVILTTDGEHIMLYRSIDVAGNTENAASIRIPIDRTPPAIEINGAQTYTVDQTVMISCTATDTGSGIINNPCASPLVNVPAYQLELGTHEIQVQVADSAGNSAAATATYTITASTDSLSVLTEKFVEGEGEEGVRVSLLEKLEKGNYQAYINEVSALSGIKLTEENAAVLIRIATVLMEG